MVEIARIRDGVLEYANAHVLPRLTPGRQFAAGMAMGIAASKADALVQDIAKNEVIKASGIIAENGMVDIDLLFEAAIAQVRRQKTLPVDIPMIGRLTFTEDDIADLYRTIMAR